MRLTDRQKEVLRDASIGLIHWTQFTGGINGKWVDPLRNNVSRTVESLIAWGLVEDVGTAVRMGGPVHAMPARLTDDGRAQL